MQPPRQLAQLLERLPELPAGALELAMGGRRIGVDQPVGDAQRDGEPHEPLLRAVVQVALQPAPLCVAGGDDPRPRGRQLLARLRVRERLRHELRERADAVLVAGCERILHRRDDDRAPELAADDDRGPHAGPEAELVQPLGERARHHGVVVDALRPAAPVDLGRERLAVEPHPRADLDLRDARRAPAADHVGRPVVAVADHVRGLRPEEPPDLLGDGREHAPGIARARHEGRHAPQRLLLLQQHRRVGAAVPGPHAGHCPTPPG